MKKIAKIVSGVLLGIIGIFVLLVAVAASWMAKEGKTNGQIVSSGITRKHLIYVPRSYDRSKPAALVISLHPAASRPEAEMELSRWNDLADAKGFIVVYPSGQDVPRVWPMGPHSLDVDVKYVSDLIDKLEQEYNIDKNRIYADGISNGGGMAFGLSCKMPERIAAIGAISAPQILSWDRCADTKPVPTIVFHGTADPVVAYNGGSSAISPQPFPPIRDWFARVAKKNECKGGPDEVWVTASVKKLSYKDCDADVALYTIEGGGHTWPGGGNVFPEFIVGKTNHEINATNILWDFYQQHPLHSAAATPPSSSIPAQ